MKKMKLEQAILPNPCLEEEEEEEEEEEDYMTNYICRLFLTDFHTHIHLTI
jgi:hypothetical protein